MPVLEISTYSILLWLTAILIGSFDLIIFVGSRSLSSRVFAAFTFLLVPWSAAQGFVIALSVNATALFLVKLQHFIGIVISFGFLYFSLVYPEDKKPKHNFAIVITLSTIAAVFFVLFFFSNLIISDIFPVGGIERWGWRFAELQRLFDVTFYGIWLVVLANIYHKWRKSPVGATRTNLKYMFFGLTLGIIPPGILNVFLPSIADYQFNWIGPIASAVWVYVIGYSIIKYRQLNVRAFIAEVLAVSMTLLMFINIFTDVPLGIYGRTAAFLVSAIVVYFLIKNIVIVTIQREELTNLTQNLQQKVAEQTKEIQRAYEVEKKAHVDLQQLNQNKNDFIIITQHHLRTPLAQIRWYANSIANGLYGTISTELSSAVSRIDNASEKLIKTLNNFLEVVQMKIGTKFLALEKTSLKKVVEILLEEFSNDIKKKSLTVTYSREEESWPTVNVDVARMKEALAILIDNAVVYNRESGSIAIEAKRERIFFVFCISNTGVGISKEDKTRLFTQSFFRTKEARRLNPTGMGVGLLVARTIIEAHRGKISFESEGDGKGVEVVVQLPLA